MARAQGHARAFRCAGSHSCNIPLARPDASAHGLQEVNGQVALRPLRFAPPDMNHSPRLDSLAPTAFTRLPTGLGASDCRYWP